MRARGDGRASERGWGALVVAIALTRGLLYAALIPPWQAPDEPWHFVQVWQIAHGGSKIPPEVERALLASAYEWRFGEFFRPLPDWRDGRWPWRGTAPFSLSYLWLSLWLRPVEHHDLLTQLYLARIGNVVLSAWIAYLGWRVFSISVSSPVLRRSMIALLLFLPQHTFINSSITDGTLAELGGTAVIYGWARAFQSGLGLYELSLILLGSGLGLWSKRTALMLLPMTFLLMLVWSYRLLFARWLPGLKRAWLLFGIVGVGSLTGWIAAQAPPVHAWIRAGRLDPNVFQPAAADRLDSALLLIFDSFWAHFGWLRAPLGDRWSGALMLLCALAAIGWLAWGWRSEEHGLPRWAAGLMGGYWLSGLLGFIGFLAQEPAYAQGRYLFPLVVPFTFLFVGGLALLFTPARGKAIAFGVAVFAIFIDTVSIFHVIFPFFYGG